MKKNTVRNRSAGTMSSIFPVFYAQKHPDEDWAETFAVWLTPDRDWRSDYADWPEALAKLEFCDSTMRSLATKAPLITNSELDEDVGDLTYSLDEFYTVAGGE